MSIMKDFYEQYASNPNFVEVVRCKDCKEWDRYETSNIGCCLKTDADTGFEDYCNYGKRKDEKVLQV